MAAQREQRLRDVIATIEEAGSIDREIIIGAIQRRWNVSGSTARFYVEDLIRMGIVISRFGFLSLRFEKEVLRGPEIREVHESPR